MSGVGSRQDTACIPLIVLQFSDAEVDVFQRGKRVPSNQFAERK